MKDLMVTAFRCDLTRIATFMMGNGISNRSFTFLDVTGGHHELSHHQGDPARIDLLEKIGRWELAIRRPCKPNEEHTGWRRRRDLLDNSMLVFTSEMGEGDAHSQRGMPLVLAGGGAGQLDPGNHYVFENEEPLADFHITMMQAMGASVSTFGENDRASQHHPKERIMKRLGQGILLGLALSLSGVGAPQTAPTKQR